MNPRLVVFFYHLMRDHLPAGVIEDLVLKSEAIPLNTIVEYSNNHLQQYAEKCILRLMGEA